MHTRVHTRHAQNTSTLLVCEGSALGTQKGQLLLYHVFESFQGKAAVFVGLQRGVGVGSEANVTA